MTTRLALLGFAISVMILAGCGGDGGASATPPPTDDVGATADPGAPQEDPGALPEDPGVTEDSGPADEGAPPVDEGTPPVDEGTPPPDEGPPPPPSCSFGAPVCQPDCGAGTVCVYEDDECICKTMCNSAQPVCAGGCASGTHCGTDCACVKDECQADAPVCGAGCKAGEVCNAACACEEEAPPPPPPPVKILPGPSRSSAIDVSPDDSLVAMVNSDDGTLTVFDATVGAEAVKAKVATSATAASEPIAVVIHPDGEQAFVANRAAGTVSQITGLDSGSPKVASEIAAGAEPVGLALSPTGAHLLIADWVQGTVSVADTKDFAVIKAIEVGGNPFAIAITNDGDDDDTDERAFVTQFFGRPEGKEGVDDGRKGIVDVIDLGTMTVTGEIELAPLASCFTGIVVDKEVTSGCFPNQLLGITLHTAFGKTRGYVVSNAASPAGPVNFAHNVQTVVSVFDVDTLKEEPALTVNLNKLIKEQQTDTDGDETVGRRFLNTPTGIAFAQTDAAAIGYVTSGASDVVLRVTWSEAGAVEVGSSINFNIPVGQNPQGLAIRHGNPGGGFVANQVSRDLSVVAFKDQAVTKTVASTPQPAAGAPDFKAWKGKRFFNTSTAIWSKEGWGSCQGCHFLGLTDNVTFKFPAGPRQSVSLDGQFASKDPSDQRALNWTAIFDETHDFENNTRGVSGGKGALQDAAGASIGSGPGVPPFSAILAEDGVTKENHQANNGSMKFLTHTKGVCGNDKTCPDWDQIDAYIQSIRSPRGKHAPEADIKKGRGLFDEGGCAKCHGGPKWTVSRVFYDPETFSGALPARTFAINAAAAAPKDAAKLKTLPKDVNHDATLVAGDDSDGKPSLKRMACVIRDVGTFGAAGGAEELRENGTNAQGKNGYNPPSLLGLALGAPYLHNGAAKTLDDLFAAALSKHTTAGNPNFILSATDRAALIAFLLSIDETTETFAIEADTVLCPETFSP